MSVFNVRKMLPPDAELVFSENLPNVESLIFYSHLAGWLPLQTELEG